jgi:hypothetical protein
MPLFVYIGHDGPRGAELRVLHRPAHLAHMEPLDAEGRIQHAGPLLDAAGQPEGSVILFVAESLDAARDVAARDPYVAKGIFERHEVHETRAVFPR